jgi:hypothetical protein
MGCGMGQLSSRATVWLSVVRLAAMRVTILMAKAAIGGGAMSVLGVGLNVISARPVPPFAVVLQFEVPWTETNKKHKWRLELRDADGHVVLYRADEPKPISIANDFEVGRPAGHPVGTPIMNSIAIDFTDLPLEPAQRYVWVLSVNGETRDDWTVGFNTRP